MYNAKLITDLIEPITDSENKVYYYIYEVSGNLLKTNDPHKVMNSDLYKTIVSDQRPDKTSISGEISKDESGNISWKVGHSDSKSTTFKTVRILSPYSKSLSKLEEYENVIILI